MVCLSAVSVVECVGNAICHRRDIFISGQGCHPLCVHACKQSIGKHIVIMLQSHVSMCLNVCLAVGFVLRTKPYWIWLEEIALSLFTA
jgi:hypothetical protein